MPVRELLGELWRHLSARRRRHFVWTSALMVASAFAEVVSLGAVLPFIGILTSPERVLAHPVGGRLAELIGVHDAAGLALPLTLLFVFVAAAAAAVRTTLLWVSTRVAFLTGTELGLEIFRRTLYQPYATHLNRNSSEVISGIVNKIHDVVFGVFLPVLVLFSSMVLIAVVTLVLVYIDPVVAVSSMGVFGGAYVLISYASRRRLRENSERISREQTQVVRALQEGLGGIRDVLLDGTQALHCEAYAKSDRRLRLAQASNAFTSQGPRFAMESLSMIALAVLAYALHGREGGVTAALPLLGVLALGAQRLLPALQQAHTSWASITGYQSTLAETLRLLDQPADAAASPAGDAVAPLSFQREIRVESVGFRYAEGAPWVLDGASLVIPKGARAGFVGATGSGKSTLLDIMMGLLYPVRGTLRVDDTDVTKENARAWQRCIAHVPQTIYLSDGTIAENIAFGRGAHGVDLERVRRAAERAQIAEFIEKSDAGYDTRVGERGVKLSGGQRQRIGLARALYRDASVLVLDEATSALDSATERSVMESIDRLGRDVTVLMIAHRLSTVRRCDFIFEIGAGRIVASGTYEQLLERSPTFRTLVREKESAEAHESTHVQ